LQCHQGRYGLVTGLSIYGVIQAGKESMWDPGCFMNWYNRMCSFLSDHHARSVTKVFHAVRCCYLCYRRKWYLESQTKLMSYRYCLGKVCYSTCSKPHDHLSAQVFERHGSSRAKHCLQYHNITYHGYFSPPTSPSRQYSGAYLAPDFPTSNAQSQHDYSGPSLDCSTWKVPWAAL
jgi:hypothetical protein